MADESSIKGQSEGSVASALASADVFIKRLNSGETLSRDESNKLNEIVELLKREDEYNKLDRKDRKTIEKEEQQHRKKTEKSFKDVKDGFNKLGNLLGKYITSIDTHIKTFTQYSIRVNAALEGTQKTYASAVQNLTNAIGSTGLAKMSDVLARMSDLTTKGLVANVEQHAFLQTISEGIVNTFNTAEATMVRLIKLQGEDSTVNRLVMQASLKEYLNQTYQNSQYVYEQFTDVSKSLLEATSLLTSSLSLSLESTVQKWMGSLSSLGLSSQAVGSLSGALGAVGSGNLRGINQNMQNLVIMGANRAGLSYSDLLTGGLSASQTDRLMYGMINYLGGLQGNNVVLSEYANLFGVNVSDLVAARNARGQLSTIAGKTIGTDASGLATYLGKYNQYLNASPATLYDNLFDNMLFGMGTNVAGDKGSYQLYKIGELIGGITSGLNLSGIVGNVVNLIGPGMQLAAALGGGEGGFSIANIGKTLKGLGTSMGNLWNDPNALLAYNMLAGTSYSPLAMAAGLGARGFSNTVSVSGSSSSSGSVFNAGGGSSVSLDEAWASVEEAASARTADDIYEFLSDDVVTVTPYVGETDVLGNIANYNRITAESTANILKIMTDIVEGNIMLSSVSIPSSMLSANSGGSDLLKSLGLSTTL